MRPEFRIFNSGIINVPYFSIRYSSNCIFLITKNSCRSSGLQSSPVYRQSLNKYIFGERHTLLTVHIQYEALLLGLI